MKPIDFREQDFKREVDKQPYTKELLKEFFDYWSEPDRGTNPKMRFEKEKTWDLGRRLARWARSNHTGKVIPITTQVKPEQQTLVERLDSVLEVFRNNPTKIEFISLAEWYDYLKINGLMKSFTQADIQIIREAYGSDNKKCRAACVSETFKGYLNNGLTFSGIFKLRQKLNENQQR